MKAIVINLSIVIMSFMPSFGYGQRGVYTCDKLKGIIEHSAMDSLEYIERLAAVQFHQKINEYRLSHGLDALRWNDTLWLISRNHSYWMAMNNKLSHKQIMGSPFYSGYDPGYRVDFVTKKNGRLQWTGENALYFSRFNGNSAKEIASNIAENAIDSWKRSPGHNENMLSNHNAHGTAFIISQSGLVYGTDLFSIIRYENKSIENPMPIASQQKTQDDHLLAINPNYSSANLQHHDSNQIGNSANQKTKTYEMEKFIKHAIIDSLYNGSLKTEKSIESAAKNHAQYMCAYKSSGPTETKGKRRYTGSTTMKRVLKSSWGLDIFKLLGSQIVEYQHYNVFDEHEYDAQLIIGYMLDKIKAEQNKSKGKLKSASVAVEFKLIKGKYHGSIVIVERRKKEKLLESSEDMSFDLAQNQ